MAAGDFARERFVLTAGATPPLTLRALLRALTLNETICHRFCVFEKLVRACGGLARCCDGEGFPARSFRLYDISHQVTRSPIPSEDGIGGTVFG